MKNIFLFTVCFTVFMGCNKEENLPDPYVPVNEDSLGYNMLLIGNSFFLPYAKKFDEMAINAGFVSHTSITVSYTHLTLPPNREV